MILWLSRSVIYSIVVGWLLLKLLNMGIHQWKFSDKVDPNLICSVCREVFENPVRTTQSMCFVDTAYEWLSFGTTTAQNEKALKEEDVSLIA